MATVERKIKKRSILRAGADKIMNSLSASLTTQELNVKIERLEKYIEEISAIDSEVLDALLETAEEDVCLAEEETAQEFTERCSVARLQLKEKLNLLQPALESMPTPSVSSSSLKLPKVKLEMFDLSPANYLTFWAMFKRIDDADLEGEVKFYYLKSCLSGHSKALIESYPVTAENYVKALSHLKNRYGRTDQIINIMYKDLLELVRSKPPILELHDLINAKVRSLETLGISLEMMAILTPLIEDCLPPESRIVWERKEIPPTENRLNYLLSFLGKEAETYERLQIVNPEKIATSTAAALVSTSKPGGRIERKPLKCFFCKGEHLNRNCDKDFTLESRKQIVRSNKLCFACLSPGHSISKCKVRVNCSKCKGRHYSIMCEGTEKAVNMFVGQKANERVILQTLLVKVGNRVVRAMIDSGSHRSYVASSLCSGMTHEGVEKFGHMLFGGQVSDTVVHKVYRLNLKSLDGSSELELKALRQDKICGNVPSYLLPSSKLEAAGIFLSEDGKSRPIELLLGADIMAKLIISVKPIDNLLAFETRLGWSLVGTVNNISCEMVNVVTSMLNCTLPSLWELDTLGIEKACKGDDSYDCMAHFRRTMSVSDDGNYSVALPWIDGHPPIPSEIEIAEIRLHQVIKRLKRMNLYNEYDQVLAEWEAEKIIEQVHDDEIVKGHYLPHRPVIREDKTTKIRPVFDASAKSVGAVSLNECLHKGPNLMSEILPLLLRFRIGEVGIVADIKKAFLMIHLSLPSDRDMLRFLWWRESKLVTFRHLRLVFGLISSPFILNATISHHLSNFSGPTAEKLKISFYVDDCVTSIDNSFVEVFRQEATEIMAKGNFELRGWTVTGDPRNQAVLGINWMADRDFIGCFQPKVDSVLTKKSLLAIIGRIYDPLGLLSAPVLYLKLILQECFKLKCPWDVPLPAQLEVRAKKWLSEVSLIPEILFPRCLVDKGSKDVELHVFCDASKVGVGACVFLRSVNENGQVNLSWVVGKSRVSPINAVTIPRLELIGAVIAARLGKVVREALGIDRITYWTDSMISLYWIQNDEWKTWVGNRVQEIRKLSDPKNWRFVPGVSNPADILSRGCLLREIVGSKVYDGPSWLHKPEEQWPITEISACQEALAEKGVIALVTFEIPNDIFVYFSSFRKNLRMLGWMFRFINNCRIRIKLKSSIVNNDNLSVIDAPNLTASELLICEDRLLRYIQRIHPPDVKDMQTLIDKDGLIRVQTKILSHEFSDTFRQPIVLTDCSLVRSMIKERHEEMYHAGTCWVLNDLRKKVWILRGRRIARKVIKNCIKCRKHRAKPICTPPTGLPDFRVNMGKVFQVTGCDLMGPLFLKDNSKVYMVLFTCAVYRAVHLEIVNSLSTEDFLLALRRMIARRGRVGTLVSDNGTNFVGAFNSLDKCAVESLKIKWLFNVPTASWWGGFFERLIGVIKNLLKASLGKALLTPQELYTVIVEIEAVMNKRPITYVYDDSGEPSPITPSMFLQQEITEISVPDLDFVDTHSLNARNRYLASIRKGLKDRFREEYLGALVVHNNNQLKWGSNETVTIGSVVWIGNENKKRQDWELGRVIEVFPGKDNVIRVVRLKTAKGEVMRPAQKLYLMEGLLSDKQNEVTICDINKPECQEPEVPVSPECPADEETKAMPEEKRSSRGRPVRRPAKFNL